MEILDLLNEESVSGACSSRASLKIQREVLLSTFEKVSRSLKYDSIFFFDHRHTYIYIYSILHILTIVFHGTRTVEYQPIFHGVT